MSRENFKRIATKVRAKDKVKNPRDAGEPPCLNSQPPPPPPPPPPAAAISEEEFKRRTKAVEDEATVHNLAALSHLEYDKVRHSEAGKLGVRVGALDAQVEKARASSPFPTGGQKLQGQELIFPTVEPWPDPVVGAEVLDQISKVIRIYVVLPEEAADVAALWCAHTHLYELFVHTPRLNITSPDKGCGKTTLLDVISCFVLRPLAAESMTAPTLFRAIEKHKPTLLADEVNNSLADKQELLAVLNAGHRKGTVSLRCVGEDNEVRAFNVFAPIALCGIGSLPDQLHDRSIIIRMERAMPNEARSRFDRRHLEKEEELCRQLMRFCADIKATIESFDPDLPAQASNRVADNWRSLFAIAQLTGRDWPQRTYAAYVKLTARSETDVESPGIRLLNDIREIFKTWAATAQHVISSAELVSLLHGIEHAEWLEWGRAQKPISQCQLAKLLRPFKIIPRSVRIGDKVPSGYWLSDFRSAFERYLPAEEAPNLL
jgi:putative DNA primase/helicase